jgi:SAM-dependent methyltransferase
VFEFVHGRVLDVGCGAGRHSLEAERRGLSVVAIDISPGAVEVCRRRGVRDVRLLPLAAVDASLGAFDTVLMMCGNFGLVGTAADAVRVLRTLDGLTTPSAKIVLDSVDPHQDTNPADLAYQQKNRARGQLPGQVTIRLRYGGSATPCYELLNLSARELEDLVADAGWQRHAPLHRGRNNCEADETGQTDRRIDPLLLRLAMSDFHHGHEPRAEEIALHQKYLTLEGQIDAARLEGDEAEARRLTPLVKRAKARWIRANRRVTRGS